MNDILGDISIDNVPEELDDHFKNFGKYASDVDYNRYGYCVYCNSRIDEFDFCACIGGIPDWYLFIAKLFRLIEKCLLSYCPYFD